MKTWFALLLVLALASTTGQIALDPAAGKLIEGDIAVQTERVLKNLFAVLATALLEIDVVALQ